MTIDKLYINQEVKNYKMLCDLINEDVKGGKSKSLQLENWSRYFTWDKRGNAFIITQIFDEPLHKYDKREGGNHNVYSKYIEVLLLDLLSKEDDYTLICSRNWLLVNLGIVNYRYINKDQRNKVKNQELFSEKDLNDWFNRAWQKTDQILFSALNNLKRRCLLDYSQELMITEYDIDNRKEVSYLANDEQKVNFMSAKRDILIEMTNIHKENTHPKVFDSIRDIYPEYYEEFYDLLSDRVLDLYGWISTYTQYKLIYNKDHIIQAIPNTELQLKKLELNQKVIDAMHNDAHTKVNNSLRKFQEEYAMLCNNWFGTPDESKCKSYKYIKSDNYIDVNDKISDIFIKLKS